MPSHSRSGFNTWTTNSATTEFSLLVTTTGSAKPLRNDATWLVATASSAEAEIVKMIEDDDDDDDGEMFFATQSLYSASSSTCLRSSDVAGQAADASTV